MCGVVNVDLSLFFWFVVWCWLVFFYWSIKFKDINLGVFLVFVWLRDFGVCKECLWISERRGLVEWGCIKWWGLMWIYDNCGLWDFL